MEVDAWCKETAKSFMSSCCDAKAFLEQGNLINCVPFGGDSLFQPSIIAGGIEWKWIRDGQISSKAHRYTQTCCQL